MMAKKRLFQAERYPSGKVVNAKTKPHRQRIIDYARVMRAAELASPLGFLFHADTIDQRLYDAGLMYRAAWEAQQRAMDLSMLTVRGQDITATGGRSVAQETPEQARAKRRAISRLDAMDLAIGPRSQHLRALQEVVLHERAPIGHAQVLDLISALRRLVMYQSVTGGRR